MLWLWKACLTWFGNLPLRNKLYLSFGWACIFTLILGGVALAGGSRSAILSLLGFILLVDLVMAWRLTQLITRPILNASDVLNHLAAHDLTATAAVESTDEAGRMGSALNDTIAHLREVLRGLLDSAETLHAAAANLTDQTASASDNCRLQSDLSEKVLQATRRLAEQSAAIAQSSAEAAAASRASAESAGSGQAAIDAAAEAAAAMSGAIGSIHEHMGRLDARSQEIGKALLVIRDISGRTNLIALNAAIEAARAGEHGRGFAVVAGEVRRLAESAQTATGEIEQMIAAIQQEATSTTTAVTASRASMEQGQARTEQARQILADILGKAGNAEALAEQIAMAAQEQSAESREIDSSAAQVATLAAGSLACSTEISTTGVTLRNSAEQLREVARQFRL